MRASMLIVTALLALGVPTLMAEEANNGSEKVARQNRLKSFIAESEHLRYLEESHRQAAKLVDRLKQGREAGDRVYDEAEVYLQRVSAELARQKGKVDALNQELRNDLPIGEIALDFALNRIDTLKTKLEAAERDVDKFKSELQSSLTEIARAKADLAKARAESARLETQVVTLNAAAKLKEPFEAVQAELEAYRIAVEKLDDAQKAADDATTMPEKDAAVDQRNKVRTARDGARQRLKKAVEELEKVLRGLNLLSSRAVPTDAGTILQAGYFAHEHDHAVGAAPEPEHFDGGGVYVEGGGVYVEGDDSIGTFDGEVIESFPVLVPPAPSVPPFTPLDPPDAPAPITPPHCVSREIPLDDPASSWRLFSQRTFVQKLPMPGDLDDLPQTSIATTTTTDAAATTSATPTPPGRERIVAPRTATRSVVFDCPASFPIVRFLNRSKSYDDEGLRIVEGMVLRFDDDGRYEVEFQAQGIATPVVLRLQLKVDFDDPISPVGSLTLPPIRLDPLTQSRLDDGRDGDGAAWLVVHRGYSSRLKRAFVHRSDLDGLPALDVRRDGAARFGSGLPPSRFLPR